MIDDIIKNNTMVVCMHLDAIKVQGEYIPTPEQDVLRHIELADSMGHYISHGLCPSCYERTMNEYGLIRKETR